MELRIAIACIIIAILAFGGVQINNVIKENKALTTEVAQLKVKLTDATQTTTACITTTEVQDAVAGKTQEAVAELNSKHDAVMKGMWAKVAKAEKAAKLKCSGQCEAAGYTFVGDSFDGPFSDPPNSLEVSTAMIDGLWDAFCLGNGDNETCASGGVMK